MFRYWINSFFYLLSQILNIIVPLFVYRHLFTIDKNLLDFPSLAVSITIATASKQIIDWGFSSRGITLLNKTWLSKHNLGEQLATIYIARLIILVIVLTVLFFTLSNDIWYFLFIFISVFNPIIFIHNNLMSQWLNVSIIVEKFIFIYFIFFLFDDLIFEKYFVGLFWSQFISFLILNTIIILKIKKLNIYNIKPIKAVKSQFIFMTQNVLNISYSNMIVPVMSTFNDNLLVVIYFGSEKIIKAMQIISNSVVISIGPLLKRLTENSFLKILFLIFLLFGLLPFLLVNIFPQFIWLIVFGDTITENLYVLNIISIALLSSIVFLINTIFFMDNFLQKTSSIIFGTSILFTFSIWLFKLDPIFLVWTIFFVEICLLIFSTLNFYRDKNIR